MCGFSDRIIPRPTDKTLCYLGGETRIMAMDRHMSLDFLISISTNEDLDKFINEYDWIAASSSSGGSGPPGSGSFYSRRGIRELMMSGNSSLRPTEMGYIADPDTLRCVSDLPLPFHPVFGFRHPLIRMWMSRIVASDFCVASYRHEKLILQFLAEHVPLRCEHGLLCTNWEWEDRAI